MLLFCFVAVMKNGIVPSTATKLESTTTSPHEKQVLRWYRGLRKVGQGYDNYEQKRTKNMITWKNVFLLNVCPFVYNSSLNIKF